MEFPLARVNVSLTVEFKKLLRIMFRLHGATDALAGEGGGDLILFYEVW